MPLRPKASSSARPPTTGGSTSGTVTSARSTASPGNRARASTQAKGTPSTVEATVAAVAHSSDSRSAVSAAGSDSRPASPRHGARTSNAKSGTSRKQNPTAAGAASNGGTPRPVTD